MDKQARKDIWAEVRKATGYSSGDIRGFASDEGFPRRLNQHQTKQLMGIVLCNWAVHDGYFEYWFLAQHAYEKFMKEVKGQIKPHAWVQWVKETTKTVNEISKY